MIHIKAILIGLVPVGALAGFMWMIVTIPRPFAWAMLGLITLAVIYLNGLAWMSRP